MDINKTGIGVKNWLKGLTTLLVVLCFSYAANAQLVNNKGALITIKEGATVIVKTGSVDNDQGFLSNAGTFIIEDDFINSDSATGGSYPASAPPATDISGYYEVLGDWENNAVFIADSSTVELSGGNQLITGTAVTQYHHLLLTGTDVKTQTIDSEVNSLLDLTDRELATDVNKMFVLNEDRFSVARTTGFVSSLGAGRLSREMASNLPYLYPTGSAITGTVIYRPIEIRPSTTLRQTMEVRMANVDATLEGFDRNVKEPDICDINPNYYHLIGRPFGVDPVQLAFFYDPAVDGSWTALAHWQNVPQWENTGTIILVTAHHSELLRSQGSTILHRNHLR